MGARLKQLELVDDEVFAQTRQVTGLGSHFKVMQTALKKGFIGEHGEGRGTTARHSRSQECRIEVRTDQTLRRGRLFQFGDNRRATCCLLAQDRKSTRLNSSHV